MKKIKLVYDKKLDKDIQLERLAKFYDSADIDEYMVSPNNEFKKININVSLGNFDLAQKIGHISGIGYQNALKMAMTIGLKRLLEDLSTNKK